MQINVLAPFINFFLHRKIPQFYRVWINKFRPGSKPIRQTAKIVDDLIMYSEKLMTDPHHYCIFIPSDPELQHHLLTAYHDSLIGMHCVRDASYNTLSQDFYWCNMHKHVKNWVRRCHLCIRFKTIPPAHGSMHTLVSAPISYRRYRLCR